MFPTPLSFWSPGRPSVSPSAGALAFTGAAPSVIAGRAIFPSAGSLAFTGQAPIVTVATGNIARTPSAGALSIVGQAPTRTVAGNQSVTPAVGSLQITGQPPTRTVANPLTFDLDGKLQNNSVSASVAYTMVGSVPTGRVIVVLGFKAAGNLSSVSDSKGNVYTVNATTSNASGNKAGVGIASAPCTVALAPGDTVTLNWSASSTGAGACVGSVTPAHTAPAFDQKVTATGAAVGATGNPTATTPATTQASEIAFGAVCGDTGKIATVGSGYSQIASQLFASSSRSMTAGYKVLSVTGAQTFTANLGASSGQTIEWAEAMATYKGAV